MFLSLGPPPHRSDEARRYLSARDQEQWIVSVTVPWPS